MKRFLVGVTLVVLAIGLIVGTGIVAADTVTSKPGPTVTIVTPAVALSSTSKVVIMGAGFEPKQQIHLLFTIAERGLKGGIPTDIEGYLDPVPVPNDLGAWVTAWDVTTDYQRIVLEGVYTLTVTDANYQAIAGPVPVVFYSTKTAPDKMSSWVKALVPPPAK